MGALQEAQAWGEAGDTLPLPLGLCNLGQEIHTMKAGGAWHYFSVSFKDSYCLLGVGVGLTVGCGPLFTAELYDGFIPSTLSGRVLTLCLSSLGHPMVTDVASGILMQRSCPSLPGAAWCWPRNSLAKSTGSRLLA